jgi:hypothetical protein
MAAPPSERNVLLTESERIVFTRYCLQKDYVMIKDLKYAKPYFLLVAI